LTAAADDAHVELAGDGKHLALTAPNLGGIRQSLASLGIRARRREGEVAVRLDDAHRLLRSGLAFDWDPQARLLAENRERVRDAAQAVHRAVAAVQASGPAAARELIGDCALVAQLDDHQVLNVATLTVPGTWGGCVFDEQGTGKTVTLIATFDVLVERGLSDTLLVVAPKSMIAEWKQEFRRFTGDLYRVALAEGDRRSKASALFAGADVIVANFETLVALQDEIIRLARRTRLVLAVDESFNVKNPDAARTAAATRVREWCTHAFVLCGTPAPNRAADVVAQFNLVDFGRTFEGLRLDKDPDISGAQVRDRLHERGLFVRNLKADVLADLPGKAFTEVEVHLAPQQQAAYNAALRDLIIDLQAIDDGTYARQIQSFLERRATLLRICADPSPIIPGYSEIPAKISALDDLLDRLVRNEHEKVVVWSFYRASLDRISKRYRRFGLVRVDGSITETTKRREAVRRFQEDPEINIFLGNPAAAGAGLTLHAARYAVYESLSNQAAHFLQSLDRIHRRGQARDVHYISLLAVDTIEEAAYRRLRTKAAAQADLLGDPTYQPPTRRMLLAELLSSTRRADS
jgi:SNF2 family DNA or RNA helicase